jgi:signal transduction histidine kinase
LLGQIIRAAKKYLGVLRVSVMLIKDNYLQIAAAEGLNVDIDNINIPIGKGISGKVAETGKEIILNKQFDDSEDSEDYQSYMSVPLKTKNKIIGVLNLTNKKDDIFNDDDIKIAKYIASQCALAVERFELAESKKKSDNLALLGKFTSSIAHDIKNLLNVVQGYIELMEIESSETPEFKTYVNAVYTELQLIHGLTLDIMDFARDRISLKVSHFEIDELLNKIEYHTKILLNQSNVKFMIDCKKNFKLFADKDKLFRVFFNLVNNSIEAVDEQNGIVKITVEKNSDYAIFYVYDNGHGIPAKNLNYIFDPFFTEGKQTGTGLGLAVVKEIILAHKGTISVKSEENEYTEFKIEIPVKNE